MKKNPHSALQKTLFQWYKKNARDLPWRKTRDPYRIWISEIMLQQTQVDTVIPYYERWLQRFPDLHSLSKAPLSDVLALWAGLGYYRRARMLHAAAGKICEHHSEQMPSNPEALQKLPGIGRYTAGAIASIAFEKKTPVLDGNVIRILTRIFGIPDDTAKPTSIKGLWDLAEALLPEKDIGDFNQALMELGATVCYPQNPQCKMCPVSSLCKAHAEGRETFYPVKSNREKLEKIRSFALVLKKSESVLLQRQPEKARWGGLWMFPFWEKKEHLFKAVKSASSAPEKWLSLRHGFTKYLVSLDVYLCTAEKKSASSFASKGDLQWVPISRLCDYALPAPHRKIAQALSGGR